LNAVTKDTIEMSEPLKEYTLIVFNLYNRSEYMMRDTEYASDVLYSLYSLSISIQVATALDYKEDFVRYFISCPNFKDYIVRWWRSDQYNLLIPCKDY
jgi:hypothetical protein